MSEYQYYEFQAIDRPLTAKQMGELRKISTRATITPTRFVNHYEWGDFKGNPSRWMEKYFDAFLYIANWGTHTFMLRLPARALDLKTARQYCRGELAVARAKGDCIVLEFRSEDEGGGDWDDDDGNGWLSALISLRGELAVGDRRALYLAWLLCAQNGVLKGNETEPAVPPGLSKLSAPLKALADFLRIDRRLIAVAAERGGKGDEEISPKEIKRRIGELPEAEKTALLYQFTTGDAAAARGTLLRRLRRSRARVVKSPRGNPRTVRELLGRIE